MLPQQQNQQSILFIFNIIVVAIDPNLCKDVKLDQQVLNQIQHEIRY